MAGLQEMLGVMVLGITLFTGPLFYLDQIITDDFKARIAKALRNFQLPYAERLEIVIQLITAFFKPKRVLKVVLLPSVGRVALSTLFVIITVTLYYCLFVNSKLINEFTLLFEEPPINPPPFHSPGTPTMSRRTIHLDPWLQESGFEIALFFIIGFSAAFVANIFIDWLNFAKTLTIFGLSKDLSFLWNYVVKSIDFIATIALAICAVHIGATIAEQVFSVAISTFYGQRPEEIILEQFPSGTSSTFVENIVNQNLFQLVAVASIASSVIVFIISSSLFWVRIVQSLIATLNTAATWVTARTKIDQMPLTVVAGVASAGWILFVAGFYISGIELGVDFSLIDWVLEQVDLA